MDTSEKSTTGCCGDEHCNSGRRNRYFPRKHFTADTYQVEQSFQQQRRQLLNRAIHGWGVVYGFEIKLGNGNARVAGGEHHLEIGAGFALDACGRELVWVGNQCADAQRVDLDDILALDKSGKLIRETGGRCRSKDEPSPWDGCKDGSCWMLRVHYAERLIAPVSLKDPCQCDQQEWDQVCETVRFSLRSVECDECCAKPCCDLRCECTHSHCCPEHAAKPAERGGCRCICDYVTKLPAPGCCAMTQVGKGLKVDLGQGVPLACVSLAKDECGNWTIGAITDDCGPRRLVKRNDLLFDLIRGCDLTRISAIGWPDEHRAEKPIRYARLKEMFGTPDGKGGNVTQFSLEFSKPVQNDTIRPDSFSIAVLARDDGDGWGRTLRVPIVGVIKDNPHDANHSLGATVVVDSDWAEGALDDINVFGGKSVTRVEFKAHGDYLLDCNGLAVDANARGLSAAPTGNGTPGDDFFSTFLVEPMKDSDQETKSNYEGI